MLSFLGGIVSGLIWKALSFFGVYRAGEKAQSAKDTSATLATVEREDEAGAQQRDTEADLKTGRF